MSTIETRRFHWWWTWNFRQEEQWLNRLSKQGLHLTSTRKGLWHTFRADSDVCYVYRLDYQPSLREKDAVQEYLAFYHDLGWEHVDQTTGWHFFRKPWVEDGENFELYTDRDSLKEHYRRIQKIIVFAFLLNLMIFSVNIINVRTVAVHTHSAGALGITVPFFSLYALLLLLLGYGYVSVRRKIGQISGKSS